MKRLSVLFIYIMITVHSNAQTFTETFTACDKSYVVAAEMDSRNKISLSFQDGTDESKKREFYIITSDIEQFARTYREFFFSFLDADSSKCTSAENKNLLLSYGRKVFLSIIAANTRNEVSPVAGVFKVKDSITVFTKTRFIYKDSLHLIKEPKAFDRFKVQKVTAEINDGFIENIKAYLDIGGETRYFTIPYPIGISSVANFKRYPKRQLFDLAFPIRFQRLSKEEKKAFLLLAEIDSNKYYMIDAVYFIFLGDLIDYDYKFGVNRRDYSPQNMTLDVNGGESLVLHKQETQKLFEAHIYSDFIGLKEEKPNGLIQLELDKRINTNSTQQLAKPWISWLFKSYGTFQYITPSIVFSKLEEHNKYLLLGDLDSLRNAPGETDTSKFAKPAHRFTSAIDMFQFQSFSGGGDVNIGYLSNHDLKYNLFFDVGVRLGLTPVVDSVRGFNNTKTGETVSSLIPHIQLSLQGTINFLPEERFNLSISDRPIFFRSYNHNIQLLGKARDLDNVYKAQKAGLLNVAELLMTLQLNQTGTGKLFGRLRFISDLTNMNSNFTQVQLGYSTFIIGSK